MRRKRARLCKAFSVFCFLPPPALPRPLKRALSLPLFQPRTAASPSSSSIIMVHSFRFFFTGKLHDYYTKKPHASVENTAAGAPGCADLAGSGSAATLAASARSTTTTSSLASSPPKARTK